MIQCVCLCVCCVSVCLSVSAPMIQNAGDYVYTAGGLDNVITMVTMLMLYCSLFVLSITAVPY